MITPELDTGQENPTTLISLQAIASFANCQRYKLWQKGQVALSSGELSLAGLVEQLPAQLTPLEV